MFASTGNGWKGVSLQKSAQAFQPEEDVFGTVFHIGIRSKFGNYANERRKIPNDYLQRIWSLFWAKASVVDRLPPTIEKQNNITGS